MRIFGILVRLLALTATLTLAQAQAPAPRAALVIGNADYSTAARRFAGKTPKLINWGDKTPVHLQLRRRRRA